MTEPRQKAHSPQSEDRMGFRSGSFYACGFYAAQIAALRTVIGDGDDESEGYVSIEKANILRAILDLQPPSVHDDKEYIDSEEYIDSLTDMPSLRDVISDEQETPAPE